MEKYRSRTDDRYSKNIKEERSIKNGIKRTIKEDVCEDHPITSRIYKKGVEDGKKEK